MRQAKNYGGILIVWDRIFGTFQGETERPVYGLTQNIRTFKPHRVASTSSSRCFRGPGWSPDGSGGGTRG